MKVFEIAYRTIGVKLVGMEHTHYGTPHKVYMIYGRCNVLSSASRTNQQELEIRNTTVKLGCLSSAPRIHFAFR